MNDHDPAKSMARPAASVAFRYGLAVASVAAALGLAHVFLYFGLPQPFTAFALSAIAITFWSGGTEPGILATVLSSLVRTFFFDPDVDMISRIVYDLLTEAQRLTHTGSFASNIAARAIVHWSPETFRLFGFDLENGVPAFEAVLERIHPDDRDWMVDSFRTSVARRNLPRRSAH